MENRRLTALKCSLKELQEGRFVKKEGFQSSYVLSKLGRRLSRVRIMGVVVDKFLRPDDKYAAITLDDGTETLRCKAFVNIGVFEGIAPGLLIDMIAKIREYNEEVYVIPEIVNKVDANYETLRRLELEKIRREQYDKIRKFKELQKQSSDIEELKKLARGFMSEEEIEAISEAEDILEAVEEVKTNKIDNKDKVLKLIGASDGIKYDEIISKSGLKEKEVDLIVQDLLESGVCFEPKPGLIKKL